MIGIVSFTAFFLQQTSMANKIIIYQIFTRLFGNTHFTRTFNGSLKENGSGKMNFFDDDVLRRMKSGRSFKTWQTVLYFILTAGTAMVLQLIPTMR